MTIRSFIAVELSKILHSELSRIIEDLQQQEPDQAFRWVSPDKIHLTLKFLGDIEQDRAEKVSEAMDRVGQKHSPFSITLHGMGCFPGMNRARVLWLGLDSDYRKPLLELQSDVQLETAALGFKPEKRRFNPHLTLARIRRPVGRERIQALIDRWQHFSQIERVENIVLYQSELAPAGAIYTELHRSYLCRAN